MSESTELDAILTDLVTGAIGTAEAARRIKALAPAPSPSQPPEEAAYDHTEAVDGTPDAGSHQEAHAEQAGNRSEPAQGPREPSGSHGVTAVQVRVTGRRVRVLGDQTIATVAVEGPHSLRRRGDLLEVISEDEPKSSSRGFGLGRIPRSREDLRRIGLGEPLIVRVNPQIEVSVELTGGSLNTAGVPYLDTVRVTGGLTELRDVTRVSDMLVQAGGASIHGDFRGGRSRVKVETGNLNVALTPTANVTITASARLGGVSWPDDGAGLDEFVAGNGAGRLDLNAFVGRISVRRDDGSATSPDAGATRDSGAGKQWWEVWKD